MNDVIRNGRQEPMLPGHPDPVTARPYKSFASDREELMAALDHLGALEQRLARATELLGKLCDAVLYHEGEGAARDEARAFLAEQEAQS